MGSPIELRIYSDASHGSTTDIPHATRGYIIPLAGGAITWASKKIKTAICLSSTEAEYIAASEAVSEIMWLTNLLQHMNIKHKVPILLVDNQPSIHIMNNRVKHSKTKHVVLRRHLVREHIANGELNLEYVNTGFQSPNILTKVLTKAPFDNIVSRVMTKLDQDFRGYVEQSVRPSQSLFMHARRISQRHVGFVF